MRQFKIKYHTSYNGYIKYHTSYNGCIKHRTMDGFNTPQLGNNKLLNDSNKPRVTLPLAPLTYCI